MAIAAEHKKKQNHKHYYYNNNDNSVFIVVETQRLNQELTEICIKTTLHIYKKKIKKNKIKIKIKIKATLYVYMKEKDWRRLSYEEVDQTKMIINEEASISKGDKHFQGWKHNQK